MFLLAHMRLNCLKWKPRDELTIVYLVDMLVSLDKKLKNLDIEDNAREN